MEREPVPVEITVGDRLISLEQDSTDVYIFSDPDFMDVSHIYTKHPDDPERRVMLFGASMDVLDQLVDMGYRLILESRPTAQDLEYWVQWQAATLDEEWEDFDGTL